SLPVHRSFSARVDARRQASCTSQKLRYRISYDNRVATGFDLEIGLAHCSSNLDRTGLWLRPTNDELPPLPRTSKTASSASASSVVEGGAYKAQRPLHGASGLY